jgi:chemotaxis protein CheZ
MRGVARQIARNAETLDSSDLRRAALLRDADVLRERLNELAIAQEYQDLTGQIIKRIIVLVEDVEAALLELLGAHATHLKTAAPLPIPEEKAVLAGPAVPGQVTTSQQDADALLASLGV